MLTGRNGGKRSSACHPRSWANNKTKDQPARWKCSRSISVELPHRGARTKKTILTVVGKPRTPVTLNGVRTGNQRGEQKGRRDGRGRAPLKRQLGEGR